MTKIFAILLTVATAFCYVNVMAETPSQLSGLTGCQLSTNVNVTTGDCSDTPPPNVANPAVLSSQTSEFGATFKRVSLPAGFPDETDLVPIYAKGPAWNSDGTKLLLYGTTGGYFYILNGTTYAYEKKITVSGFYPGYDNNARWSKTDPNIIYYVYLMTLRSYNISTDAVTTIHTFTDGEIGGSSIAHIGNGDEGNADDTDRYWVFIGTESSWVQQRVFVYDRTIDSVLSSAGYGAGGLCGIGACPTNANWVGMSHSGDYVVINWNADSSDGVMTTRGNGTESFNRSLVYQAKQSEKNWHCDVAQLSDGTDVFIGKSNLSGTNGYDAWRVVKLSDGSVSSSCMAPSYRDGWHVSGRTTSGGLKGWVLMSTYEEASPTTLGTGEFASENFALNLDTCEVRRIAHAQSIRGGDYWAEPHAIVNNDFTKIVWGSNWRNNGGAVYSYVAELGAAAQGSGSRATGVGTIAGSIR